MRLPGIKWDVINLSETIFRVKGSWGLRKKAKLLEAKMYARVKKKLCIGNSFLNKIAKNLELKGRGSETIKKIKHCR